MAATRALALSFIVILFHTIHLFRTMPSSYGNIRMFSPILSGHEANIREEVGVVLVFRPRYSFSLAFRHFRILKPVTKWDKHGHTLLAKENERSIDITVYMDIERNPGPLENSGDDFHDQMQKASTISYSRGKLLSFSRKSIKPPSIVISLLKSLNLFKYRGTRAGVRRRSVSSGVERDGRKITVIIGRRPLNQLKLTSSVI